jgi:alpha-glucuronidase
MMSSRSRHPARAALIALVLWLAALGIQVCVAHAKDGHELWLRYHLLEEPWRGQYQRAITQLIECSEQASPTAAHAHAAPSSISPTLEAARAEFAIEERQARWWRDACVAYFQSISKRPLPPGVPAPERTLTEYESICYPDVPGYISKAPACQPAKPLPP